MSYTALTALLDLVTGLTVAFAIRGKVSLDGDVDEGHHVVSRGYTIDLETAVESRVNGVSVEIAYEEDLADFALWYAAPTGKGVDALRDYLCAALQTERERAECGEDPSLQTC